MFNLLLEKPDRLMYQIFCCLQETNPYPLAKLAIKLEKSPAVLRRTIRQWQKNSYNRSTGIGFYVTKEDIRGIYANEHASLFFSTLLHRSEAFQLLLKVLDNPYASGVQLQREMHLSPASFQRRVRQLEPLLQHYHLQLSFKKMPALKGTEMQIRWFTLLVSLLADPPFHLSPINWWHRYEEICLHRPLWLDTWQPAITHYYQPPFHLNERGSTFLWRQLIGLEPLWMNQEMAETLSFALHAHTSLATSYLLEVQQHIHRIHCCCSFFSGTLFFEPTSISKEVHRLTQSFRLLLPHYDTLLAQHPELPMLYQRILKRYQSFANELMVSED